MLQLNPPLPLVTPRGKGMAVLVNDPGTENHLEWTVLLDNGEVWTFQNPDVRAQENQTAGRPIPKWWRENNARALGAEPDVIPGISGLMEERRPSREAVEQELQQTIAELCEGIDLAWGVISNVSAGDLAQQSETWREAATEFHDHVAMAIAAAHAAATARDRRVELAEDHRILRSASPSVAAEPAPADQVAPLVLPNRLTEFIGAMDITRPRCTCW